MIKKPSQGELIEVMHHPTSFPTEMLNSGKIRLTFRQKILIIKDKRLLNLNSSDAMLFSKTCEHAIQTVLYLAQHPDLPFISVREIADQCSIPFHFLGKIVQMLTKKGILHSYKGPNGGIHLARSPEEITLFQVVEAIESTNFSMNACATGTSPCHPENPCVLHNDWSAVRKQIWEMLAVKSLAELVKTHKIY